MTGREIIRGQLREITDAIGVADTLEMIEGIIVDKRDHIDEQRKTAEGEKFKQLNELAFIWTKTQEYLRSARFNARSTMAVQ